jgi:hypothetical protein
VILCRVLVRRALGKEGVFVECHLIHLAKELVKGPTGSLFVECQYSRHSVKCESLAKELVKGPTWSLFVECQYSRHSAKCESLPSLPVALGTASVAVT